MKKKNNDPKFNCADIERLAQQYIDGQLSPQEHRLFEEHLEYCLPCDKKVQFELKLKEIVRVKARALEPDPKISAKLKNLLKDLP